MGTKLMTNSIQITTFAKCLTTTSEWLSITEWYESTSKEMTGLSSHLPMHITMKNSCKMIPTFISILKKKISFHIIVTRSEFWQMSNKKSNRLIRDWCFVLAFGLLTLVTHLLPPHRTTVMEGDMSISRPVSNTFPYVVWIVTHSVERFPI